MRSVIFSLIGLGLFLITVKPLEAKTYYVPKEFRSIQAAIDACDRGDSVKVAPGVYYENLILRDGRNLIGSGADKTIITDDEVGAPDPIIQIDGNCLLKGFTITGARGAGIGHAIMIIRGAPTVEDNIIRDNSYTGIGIHSETALTTPLITKNSIYGNGGAGIANLGQFSKATIIDNDIFSNTNAGVACTDFASPTIENNRLYNNGVGVASKDEALAIIKNNTIFRNKLVGIPVVKKGKAIIYKNKINQNSTVGINADGNAEVWVVNNEVWENGTEAISIKNKSKAYLAFNKIESTVSVSLQVRDSDVTAVKNKIACNTDINLTVPSSYLTEQGIEEEHIKELTSYGPGVISIKNSKYLAGKNSIEGKIDIDELSSVKEIPNEELPVSIEKIAFPEFVSNPETSEMTPHDTGKEGPHPVEALPKAKEGDADYLPPPSGGCLGFF